MTDLPPSAPSSPRWMRIALAISLALNLAVIGMAGGAAWRFHDPERRPGPVRDLGFGPFSAALSPEDRKELRRAFIGNRGDFREARGEMRRDFGEILSVLRAEPYDAAALQTVMARQQARGAEMMALGQTLLAERIAAMAPDERRAFADRLEKSLTRPHGRDRREERARD